MEEKFSLIKRMVLKPIMGSDLCGLFSSGILILLVPIFSCAIDLCSLTE